MGRLLVLGLAVTAGWFVWLGGAAAGCAPRATSRATGDARVSRGHELFLTSCSSCHGADGAGTGQGPTLIGVGAAAADFQLTTGRMPLANPKGQPVRKPRAFTRREIDALVAYVASLGAGPPIPKVDIHQGNLSE